MQLYFMPKKCTFIAALWVEYEETKPECCVIKDDLEVIEAEKEDELPSYWDIGCLNFFSNFWIF